MKQGQHISNGSFKLSRGFRSRKISDVLTDDNLIASGHGNRIFEMAAYSQDWRQSLNSVKTWFYS